MFFRTSVEKTKFSLKSEKNNGYTNEDVFTFMIISSSFLLRMRNVFDNSCRENQNTNFMFNNVSPKIVLFMRKCRKIRWSQRGRKLHHNMVHTRGMLNIKAICTHTHAHATSYNTYCFSSATMICERVFIRTLSVLFCVYIIVYSLKMA